MAGFTSILFPGVGAMSGVDAAPDCFADLYLDQIIDTVTAGHADDHLAQFFHAPLHDDSTVAYRHEVFGDLECDQTRKPIENFVAGMRAMRRGLDRAAHVWHPLQQRGWFIDAVQTYCHAMVTLRHDLADIELASRGLRDFAHYVAGYVDSHAFQTLADDTQTVRTELRRVRYAVHIRGLRVHVEKFDGQTDYSAAVTTVFERFATEAAKDYRVRLNVFPDMNHVEEQILACVAKLYPEPFALLDAFCKRNQHFIEPTLARFEREIHFYLCYLTFIRHFTPPGLTFSYPEAAGEPGIISAHDAFDLALAIKAVDEHTPVIGNDFRLSGPERILVVTGPNQGGKTTFARMIGQCTYLASLGCPVPASRAVLRLPDQIYTHFERQESLSTLHGKLDDELVRIHDILSRATVASVVIMNESFASTTVDDALRINAEVLHRIVELGCVAVCVSFLDELASLDPACVSMVGEVATHDPSQRTFKFTRRPADGLAYAAALAHKYGLGRDVLRRRISR